MPPSIIAINGDLGSGKTTVARELAGCLTRPYVSTGELQRAIAESLNLTTLELNRRAELDASIDQVIDERVREIPNRYSEVVVDSRMAWMFIPQALKVRLLAHPLTTALRILQEKNRKSEQYQDFDQALDLVRQRRGSERRRFLHTYSVDIENLEHYDLVVQTDQATPAQVADAILARADEAAASSRPLVCLNPRTVFPTQSIRSVTGQPKTSGAIEVAYVNDDFFVIDGHNRLARAIVDRTPFVEGVLVAQEADCLAGRIAAKDFVAQETSRSMLYDWEDAFSFRFAHHPPGIDQGVGERRRV